MSTGNCKKNYGAYKSLIKQTSFQDQKLAHCSSQRNPITLIYKIFWQFDNKKDYLDKLTLKDTI